MPRLNLAGSSSAEADEVLGWWVIWVVELGLGKKFYLLTMGIVEG